MANALSGNTVLFAGMHYSLQSWPWIAMVVRDGYLH